MNNDRPLFSHHNNYWGLGRKEPLDVEAFLTDLKEIFTKHKVKTITKGTIGFQGDKFGIIDSTIDISEEE
ncbi:hypothetical protein AB1282_00410 [Gottfriedia sp. S16(2024)]|uniref:hypothetical protein n=1 Tax=Gottfriedia sp. S16(2024) TaxID=3162883 RepID=UPI003D238D43